MPRRLQVVLESDGNVTKYKPMAVYNLVAFFRSNIGIKLMKLHFFYLDGQFLHIAGTVHCTVYTKMKRKKRKKKKIVTRGIAS